MTRNEMLELKYSDFVQVKVNDNWCNAIVVGIDEGSDRTYIHYFYNGEKGQYGDSDYFIPDEIRFPINNLIQLKQHKDSTKLVLRKCVGEVKVNDIKVAELSVNWNGYTPMVEIDGNVFGLDTDNFVHEIVENHTKYLEVIDNEKYRVYYKGWDGKDWYFQSLQHTSFNYNLETSTDIEKAFEFTDIQDAQDMIDILNEQFLPKNYEVEEVHVND